MLKRLVPTWAQQPEPFTQLAEASTAAGVVEAASISKTSLSGRSNLTKSFQLRGSLGSPTSTSSCQWSELPPSRLNLTIRPV